MPDHTRSGSGVLGHPLQMPELESRDRKIGCPDLEPDRASIAASSPMTPFPLFLFLSINIPYFHSFFTHLSTLTQHLSISNSLFHSFFLFHSIFRYGRRRYKSGYGTRNACFREPDSRRYSCNTRARAGRRAGPEAHLPSDTRPSRASSSSSTFVRGLLRR